MTSHVDAAVKARIAAARRRTEDIRRRRAELAAARQRGLAARHTQKLRRQTAIPSASQPVIFRDWLNENRRREEFAPLAPLAAVPGTWATAEELHAELHRSSVHGDMCVLLTMVKDAWLDMTDQWQHDCADCRADCTDERYMVHDHVWEAAGMCEFGFLCIGCIEQRLGRRLNATDFLDVPLNHDPGFQRSERLTARLASHQEMP